MAEKQRVLVVEDDPGTLALLTQIVIRAGYEPIRARRGEEGWTLLQKEQVDLILLDLMMRDVDGWTLLETIKADEHLAPIPVVIVSARHPKEDPDRTEAHASMFVAYYVKPFEVDDLVAKLKEILQ